MTSLIARVNSFVTREEGSTMVEYGLMVALVAITCIGVVALVGVTLSGMYDGVGTSIGT
jgi:pilus assembly protein Flp/PilA